MQGTERDMFPLIRGRTGGLCDRDVGGDALALRVRAGKEEHAEVADNARDEADANNPAAGVQVVCGQIGVRDERLPGCSRCTVLAARAALKTSGQL